MNPRRTALSALLLLSACAPAATRPTGAITDGESLIRAMHDRYAGRWYNTLTFAQRTTRHLPNDSVVVESWREYGAMPGRLRIEMGDPGANNGALYANDSIYRIRGGQVIGRRAERNPLMILGFDVYVLPVERSVQLLREEGFPLSPVRTETWQGRPAYVVGGAPGDLHSAQFWIDAERLVFVRALQPVPGDTAKTLDFRFEDYRPIGRAWVSPAVDILVDGRSVQREEYSDIRVDLPLDPSLFHPDRWATAVHPAGLP